MKLQSFRLKGTAISCLKIQSCHRQQDLRGQTVAIIGLGKSGIAATRLALARGASVVAIDQNLNVGSLLEQSVAFGKDSVRTILGDFDTELLRDADIVVVSPGVPLQNYGLASLLALGKCVMSELDFAAQALPTCTEIIAVTGTNGKSTVTTFAGQMLNHLGIPTFVGGNLGVPLSDAAFEYLTLSPQRPFQVAVVEVSSYQLEVPNSYFFPSVAVVLNLSPDHLERHKTMKNYAMTKCRVFSHMKGNKIGILPPGNQYLLEALRAHTHDFNPAWIGTCPGVKVSMEAKVAKLKVPAIGCDSEVDLSALRAIGTHNYINAAVAALSVTGLDIGINAKSIASTISKLRVPCHRMQVVHVDNNGVTWIDDSKATNVEAMYSGVMGVNQKAVLLLGGVAKDTKMEGLDGFEQLVEPLKRHRGVITVCNGFWVLSVYEYCMQFTSAFNDCLRIINNLC
ncbi:PREDICTED: uncharacterized protein LOC109181835 isoform X2 [Ipomoea nil]|uniref:uncharacterized protein LOC109181835 isoform X2 n=1 Tax=Ipomoea nil TaxID=35883 RepID=UPI0009011001|nr:PREDICTED: uncharacterized protein LOC109181835 isoform X2 [Ipomoea nil]